MSFDSDQSGNLNVNSLSINTKKIAYDNLTENENMQYFHNYASCANRNANTNTTMRAEHISTCKLCAKNIFCSCISSGTVNSTEYNSNGKLLVDKSQNLFAKSVSLGTDVKLTSDSNGKLLINNTPLYDSYVDQQLKKIDESQFCQKWKIPYTGKGIITGYTTSVINNGLYQTIIDSAGNISVSSDSGYTFGVQNNVTNGTSLGSVAMSEDGKYQLTADFRGNIYQSSDFGKKWEQKAIFTIYDIVFLDYISVSVSQSGKYQVLCVEGKSYVSDNYGLSFKQLVKLEDRNVFKKVIVKEAHYFDFTYNIDSSNYLSALDQTAIFVGLTRNLTENITENNNIRITSTDGSGNWLNDNTNNWIKTGAVSGILTSFSISNDLMFASIVDSSGNVYKSDTSGGLINNQFYEDTSGLYSWSTNIVQNIGNDYIADIAMDESGSYQTIITNDGYIFSTYNQNIDSSGNWSSTKLSINDQSLLFLSISADGSTQYAIDETGRIFKSVDYGVSWLGGTSNSNFTCVACSESGQYASIIDTSGYIITTSSYGDIWSAPRKITPNLTDQGLIKITMSSNGKYQYAISKYNIYQSLDYGSTWNVTDNIEATNIIEDFSNTIGFPIILAAPLVNIAISGDGSTLAVLDSSYGQTGGSKLNSNDQYIYVFENIRNTNSIYMSLNTYTVYNNSNGYIASDLSISESGNCITMSDKKQNIAFSNTFGQTWELNAQYNGYVKNTYIAMSKFGDINCFAYSDSSNNQSVVKFYQTVSPPNIETPNNQLIQYDGIYKKSNLGNELDFTSISMSNDGTDIIVSINDASGNGKLLMSNDQSTDIEGDSSWKSILETNHNITSSIISGNGKYVYAIGENGDIYISNSNGKSFFSSATITKYDTYNTKTFLALDMSADGSVQSALDFSGNIYVSTDTGTTWNDPINISAVIETSFMPVKIKLSANGNIQYVIGFGNDGSSYLIYSNDFGISWSELFSISQSDAVFFGLATSSSGQHITLGSMTGDVYISHNFGKTFEKNNIIPNTNNYVQQISDLCMSACGEYQSLITLAIFGGSIGSPITYVSNNYGKTWKPIANTTNYSIGSSIAISDSGQYQSYVGFDIVMGSGYVTSTSNFGQDFTTVNSNSYFLDASGSRITNLPISIAMSSSGKYQAMLALTQNTSLVFLYKSTDYGKTWNLSETLPLVILGRKLFGDYFEGSFFDSFILFILFTRFKISADGQYIAIALNDSIYLSHCPEISNSSIIDTLNVTNNATINSLETNSINVNGGYIAKTKIVNNNYNADLSDYIICVDTHGCIVQLPNDAPIGQMIIITNGKNFDNNYSYKIKPPIGGRFNSFGVNVKSSVYGAGGVFMAKTILSLGNNNWRIISSTQQIP